MNKEGYAGGVACRESVLFTMGRTRQTRAFGVPSWSVSAERFAGWGLYLEPSYEFCLQQPEIMNRALLLLALVAGASAFTTPALNGLTLRSPKTGESRPRSRKTRLWWPPQKCSTCLALLAAAAAAARIASAGRALHFCSGQRSKKIPEQN